MFDFRVGSSTYRVGRPMDAFTQLAVIARVSPLFASGFGEIIPLVISLRQQGINNIADAPLEKLSSVATPVARELAKMPDADRQFVLSSCLDLCERQEDGKQVWSKVWSSSAGRSMHQDINDDLGLMLRITLGVFQGTFSSFFPESLFNMFGQAKPKISKS